MLRVDGRLTIWREAIPFPKPIRVAIEMIRDDASVWRWLEWRSDKHSPVKMVLTLVTMGERRNLSRCLWGTWERDEAAGMERALRAAGVDVAGGDAWGLDLCDGEEMAWWFLPQVPPSVEDARSLGDVFGVGGFDAVVEGGGAL